MSSATKNPQTAMLAERIKAARGLADLSQAKAAEILGVATRTYIRWETNESDAFLSRLDDIAAAFNTTTMELSGDLGYVVSQIASEMKQVRDMVERIATAMDL